MERGRGLKEKRTAAIISTTAIPSKKCEIKRRERRAKINFKSQKLTSSYRDLEPSHIKSSAEMRNMEDRRFYVGCNWTSEENDLLKVRC